VDKEKEFAVSNAHTPDQDGGWSSNGNGFVSRRDMRANNPTGAFPAIGGAYGAGRGSSSAFDFEALLVSLRELFERDRQIASQQDATRCGICYLYFPVSELHYRADGFYLCPACASALGNQSMPMLRSQQIMDQ
jgi:hypothetical protein